MSARLVLEDGSVFQGVSFGSPRPASGEVVFNTGMVGYPESFTDPSYNGQILVLSYPLIGNYGVPGGSRSNGIPDFFESERIQIRGLIVSDYSDNHSHWNSKKSLSEWLAEERIPALCGIDTRMLTKRLREKGVMLGKIVLDEDVPFYDPNQENLAEKASVQEPLLYPGGKRKVVLIDCGAKNHILRSLLKREVSVLRVPWNQDFLHEDFDGVVISNGPGDPKMCRETIAITRRLMEREVPTFGICLGNQILALAAGGDTYKLKYGHRSQNQPCIDRTSGRCYITTQNHGYAVDMKRMPKGWEEWFVNANDGTNEGLRHKSKPFFSSQFHPEHTPGPTDTEFLFDEFVRVMG